MKFKNVFYQYPIKGPFLSYLFRFLEESQIPRKESRVRRKMEGGNAGLIFKQEKGLAPIAPVRFTSDGRADRNSKGLRIS
ncbi:MAG: hypothetical protein J6S14_08670 [Clostridia bacterium]|nr:hypothetical protein [Clostridia bacterium]